jgi:hypothetical protein
MSAVSEALQTSRMAHAEWSRLGLTRVAAATRAVALTSAQTARLEAETLDPDHTDPEWSGDAAPSETILAFYADWLSRHA